MYKSEKIAVNGQKYALRFRKWSRAAYAILQTIHKEVSIGQLTNSIADASQIKGGENNVIDIADYNSNNEYDDDNAQQLNTLNTTALLTNNLVIVATPSAAAAPVEKFTDNENYKVGIATLI